MAVLKSCTLTVTVSTGVASVYVNYGSGTKTFTSSGTLSVSHGTNVSWTATAATGYNLSATSGTLTMTGANTIAPTATIKTFTVRFFVNGSVAKTVTVNYGQTVASYTPSVAGYNFGGWYTNSGLSNSYNFNSSVTQDLNIYAKMTVKSFTVSIASYSPADADAQFSWKLEWVTGKSKTGAVTDYVTFVVASDGMSVTLTFNKDFTGAEMLLTCYATADATVKATCTVTCGS